jgi:hypothetical protein
MASTRRRVRFTGNLYDENGNQVAECSGWAEEVTLPGVDTNYIGPRIERASKDLPPGNYTLVAFGKSYPYRYINGHWLAPS